MGNTEFLTGAAVGLGRLTGSHSFSAGAGIVCGLMSASGDGWTVSPATAV